MEQFKQGDTVTISSAVSIPNPLSDYGPFKPHASITRVLGDNPAQDVAEMEALLHAATGKALLACIESSDVFIQMLDSVDGDLPAFTKKLQERYNGNVQKTRTVVRAQDEGGAEAPAAGRPAAHASAPRKTGPAKKG
jgi:hypothetical protein